jgi:DNA-binding transcriptional LysR family regulator
MQCESLDTLKAAVEAGVGLGFFYRDAIRLELKSRRLKTVKIAGLKKMDIQCFVMRKKNVSLSPHAANFVRLLREWVERSGTIRPRRHGPLTALTVVQ